MLSIVIPTLNEESYLPLLLKSIKKQIFNENYEIIVADAGSKDRTKEIAKEFGAKVVSGGLPARGRNEGAKHASGDLILFLDADLNLPQGFLANSLEEFRNRKLDIASYRLIPRTDSLFLKNSFNFFYNWPITISQKIVPHGSMGILVKKDIFEKAGGFDEKIKLAEDHFFTREAARFGKFGILKSTKLCVPLRRFQKDGYLKTGIKYFLCEAHMFFIGPVKSDFFRYRFNHYDETKINKF